MNTHALVISLHDAGHSDKAIAKRLGIPYSRAYAIRRAARPLGIKPAVAIGDWFDGCGYPSPEEIRERAAAIRANWTPEIEQARRAYQPGRLRIPEIDSDLAQNFYCATLNRV